jgi:hypothetical protein
MDAPMPWLADAATPSTAPMIAVLMFSLSFESRIYCDVAAISNEKPLKNRHLGSIRVAHIRIDPVFLIRG